MPRKAQIANRAGWGAYLKRNWELYLFVVPALIYLLLYCYYPMYGVQIAFKNFRVTKGITGSEWVGLEHFRKFFSNPSCRALIKNTLVISLYSLVVGFPLPIIFALTLNEVAAVFNFSPNYLSQLFAQNSERGFVEYVTTARIAALHFHRGHGQYADHVPERG